MSHKIALIEAIKTAGAEFPELVFDYYVKEKIIKSSVHNGFQLTHGAFLDADVLKRADDTARISYLEDIIKDDPNSPKSRNARQLIQDIESYIQ